MIGVGGNSQSPDRHALGPELDGLGVIGLGGKSYHQIGMLWTQSRVVGGDRIWGEPHHQTGVL